MDVDGSKWTRLTENTSNDWSPSWSPDGTKIAFHSDRDGPGDMGDGRHQYEIYVINPDGSSKIRLTYHRASEIESSWGPGG